MATPLAREKQRDLHGEVIQWEHDIVLMRTNLPSFHDVLSSRLVLMILDTQKRGFILNDAHIHVH